MDEFVVKTASASTKKMSLLKFHRDDKFIWNDVKVRKEGDHHPWQLKMGSGKSARRFKAVKEGGVSDHASYFVFFKVADSQTYEVCPISEWYNVSATLRYKALSSEEAERKFEQRDKMLNLFSVMHLKNKDGETNEEGTTKDKKGFKVSEFDEWDSDGPDQDGSDAEDNKKTNNKNKKKNKKKGSGDDEPNLDEPGEESDEGDFEREVDYMSDSSSSSDEEKEDKEDIKGISDETALKNLLLSDNEDEDEDEIKKESLEGDKTAEEKHIKQEVDPDLDRSMSERSSDSDDSDIDESKINSLIPVFFMKKENNQQEPDLTSKPKSKSQTTNPGLNVKASVSSVESEPSSVDRQNLKRKVSSDSSGSAKRPCATDSGQEIEDLVRRYLMRKPMTTKALLKQLKAKMKGSGDQKELEVVKIAEIIRKINPSRQQVNNELLLFIRAP